MLGPDAELEAGGEAAAAELLAVAVGDAGALENRDEAFMENRDGLGRTEALDKIAPMNLDAPVPVGLAAALGPDAGAATVVGRPPALSGSTEAVSAFAASSTGREEGSAMDGDGSRWLEAHLSQRRCFCV